MKRLAVVFAVITPLLWNVSLAGDLEEITKKVDAEGAKTLEVSVELGAGEFTIDVADMAEVTILEAEYDRRYVADYEVSYRVKGSTGILDVESVLRRRKNIDTERNLCHLTMSTRYPATLDLDLGACEAQVDLGGMPLEELRIDIGAASGEIEFSAPNPSRMEHISIDAGAASLEFNRLGNANFEEFSFDGGAGSFDLDFRGEYHGESMIDIDIGLGSADITLPAGVPVQIITDNGGWLSSVDIHNDDIEEVRGGLWESDDFDGAGTRIIVELDVGLGSVDIYFKK